VTATTPRPTPYGEWASSIGSDTVAAGSVSIGGVAVSGSCVYWTELRPDDGGRSVIVRRTPDGRRHDVLPAPYSARTRVHEYGGGAACYAHDGTVYFSNADDQRLYSVRPGGEPVAVTAAGGSRYADAIVDDARGRLICVREHHGDSAAPVNCIAEVDLRTGRERVLVEGDDFYSTPRLGPDGTLSWVSWNHPLMPWTGCELRLARLDKHGSPGPAHTVAGGPEESIFQPTWGPDGVLYFASDRSGWWNLYRHVDGAGVSAVTAPMEAEFGLPQWVFRQTTFAFLGDGDLVGLYHTPDGWQLARIDRRSGTVQPIRTGYTTLAGLVVDGDSVLTVASGPARRPAVVRIDLATGGCELLHEDATAPLRDDEVSTPRPVEFLNSFGQTVCGYHYPPRNRNHVAPPGERPPLLVISHGGPTAYSEPVLSAQVQFWTSRGFAVLDVNYGGSTGLGRAYRERLTEQWGVLDVDDCVSGARHLAGLGLADPARMAIRGRSAGGYTTLCALTFHDVFKAGASYFGVGDLAALAADTHKFESRYLDSLIGPLPQAADRYVERSPIHHTERLNCPIIFFQGADDRVVPPAQAEAMVRALGAKGIPVEYILFDGEGHGFRRAETIRRAIDAELAFYGRVFGFTPRIAGSEV
jgi:dipeptidyl aminopeptidase/acylaminoacyl peptidase